MRSRRVRVLFTFSKFLIFKWLRDGKPFPTFGSPTLENETTVFGTHPFSESMRALATAPIRLVRPFHFVQSPKNAARNGEQTVLKDELDMIVTVLDPVNARLAGHHAFSVYFLRNFAWLSIYSERCIIE